MDDNSSVDRKSSFICGCSTSVDADWFYPRIDDKIRGLLVYHPRIALFLSVNISCNNVRNINKTNLRSLGICAM